MKHSPGGWADIATAHEEKDEWQAAAKAWTSARGASIGHNRRDRYEEQADRCWAKFLEVTS
jgi:hypothetical protein